MILADLFSIILRLAELAFAAIVAGLNGDFLHASRNNDAWTNGRFIYTEVVAGISIVFAIVWLIPFHGNFIHWPVDFIISVCWFVAFGLLVNWLGDGCGYVFDWGNVSDASFHGTGSCSQFKAIEAFSFLSALLWLVSCLLGIYWVRRHTTPAEYGYYRRRWYRSAV